MNYNIDFSTVPNIHEKISTWEIQKLNDIFQQPEIIEKLKEIERYRKKRLKVFWYVTLLLVIITLIVGYFFWKIFAVATGSIFAIFLAGLFYRIGTWDDSSGIIEWVFSIWIMLYGWIYVAFRSKIEIPLKRDVMSRICNMLHPDFKYSYDNKYSFNDISDLVNMNFLKSYTAVSKVEDSSQLHIERDGKAFEFNGFEIKTTKTQGSWKSRKTVTTNHDYLMRIVFPYARIPIKDNLQIIPKFKTSLKVRNSFLSIILGILSVALFFWLASMITLKMGFIGLFSFIIFPLILVGIFVLKNYAKKWGRSTNEIHLENTDFEKMFDIYCDDEIGSRMILTPAFMDKLITFVQKTGNIYSFLFTENKVYIKRKISGRYMDVRTGRNMFKNLQWFLQFYIDMKEVMSLSQELHLLYLSKTIDTTIEKQQFKPNPIPFVDDLWFLGSFLSKFAK